MVGTILMRSGPFKGDWDGAGPFWFGGETSECGEVLDLIEGSGLL